MVKFNIVLLYSNMDEKSKLIKVTSWLKSLSSDVNTGIFVIFLCHSFDIVASVTNDSGFSIKWLANWSYRYQQIELPEISTIADLQNEW